MLSLIAFRPGVRAHGTACRRHVLCVACVGVRVRLHCAPGWRWVHELCGSDSAPICAGQQQRAVLPARTAAAARLLPQIAPQVCVFITAGPFTNGTREEPGTLTQGAPVFPCVFITAGPITKLFAGGGEEESGRHVL